MAQMGWHGWPGAVFVCGGALCVRLLVPGRLVVRVAGTPPHGEAGRYVSTGLESRTGCRLHHVPGHVPATGGHALYDSGKTAFITALYIIFVPIGAAFLGNKIRWENWLGAVLALAGLYYLSIHGSVELSFGDVLVFVSALFWTAHILFIDRFACLVDPIELSTTQIGICTWAA